VRPEHPAPGGGAHRIVQLTPFVEEQSAHRIGLSGSGRIIQRLDEAVAAVEQDLQQLVAELLVADRVAELLDRKNQKRVPLVERVLKGFELGGRGRGGVATGAVGTAAGAGNRGSSRDV